MATITPELLRQWLGAATTQSPASPEELLGVAPGEDDPALIVQAAQGRRHRLESTPPPDPELARALMAAIDEAERSLLERTKSATQSSHPISATDIDPMAPFDPSLLSREPTKPAAQAAPATRTASSAEVRAAPQEYVEQVDPTGAATAPLPVTTRSTRTRAARTQRRRRTSSWFAICAGIVLGGCIVVGGAWAINQGWLPSITAQSVTQSPHVRRPVGDPTTPTDNRPTPQRAQNPTSGKPDVKPVTGMPDLPNSNAPDPSKRPPTSGSTQDPPPAPSSPQKLPPAQPESSSPQPKPMELTESQRREIEAHFQAARIAMEQADFAKADAELSAIKQLPLDDDLRERVGYWQLVSAYARQFHERLAQAIGELQGGTELHVMTKDGEKICAVVEASRDLLVIKVEGRIQRYPIDRLPPGLALAIAHRAMDVNDPVSKVVDGAYLATRPHRTARDIELAKRWWQQARAANVDIGTLEKFFDDNDEPK